MVPLSYNRLLAILTVFSVLSLTFLYLHLNGHWRHPDELTYFKFSITDRLCVGQNIESVLCRLQEVHSRQIMDDSHHDHHHKKSSNQRHRDIIKDLDRADKRGIVNLIMENELKKKLMSELKHYHNYDNANSQTAVELDTFYKNLTSSTDSGSGSGDGQRKLDGWDFVEVEDHVNFSADRDFYPPKRTTSSSSSSSISTLSPSYTAIKQTQKCNIPVVDPFHREVQPYVTYKWMGEKCTLRWRKSYVEEGVLHVVGLTDAVENVTVNYIKRVDDEENVLDAHLVYDAKTMPLKEKLVIPLEDDFIKIDIVEKHNNNNTKVTSEYHMYPLKKPPNEGDPPFEKYSHKKNKYNVLMIMTDSVSHACAQRYIPKTYKYLSENPNTVIMKGHTIVGDATTPQISSMFFGAKPGMLSPEGRKGHSGARSIDKWPSIFKDYKRKGYVTIHSEDQAWISAFNFRLMGFEKQPAFKYLRSWWQRSADLRATDDSRSDSCPMEYALNYYKDFRHEYAEELSLTYLSTSALTHNEPEKIQMFDDRFLAFFQDMKSAGKLNSTIVLFFGDHGMREGDFRQTAQGSNEERLPFMSVTLPPRFQAEHPLKVRNLKRNSKVLTTPYDIHVTLKHLLSLSEKPEKHVFGQSLFRNIEKRNRTCSEAGVPFNWCVCTKLYPVDSKDSSIVLKVATEMVRTINQFIHNETEVRDHCARLSLDKIVRVGVFDPPFDFDRISYETYQIVFRVLPSRGVFEGTAEYQKDSGRIKVNLNFSRVNMYGSQPRCIEKKFPYLRKFCFCKA